ncbi:NAD-dependent epimerase/dehydratase [Terriglobus saanensis SP1PR4]|uniref:NAD-dependent epimerase/dehydratase n=2 Tax=Terriglobus saanensis TaxID=870903 RepID=E8UYH4_TERSS|nr:NAD-dependent epimerase/dehydratase [Terriglobus saanensis SP1PR4]
MVLVTGAAGFIGRHVAHALTEAGFGVRKLLEPASGSNEALNALSSDEAYGDICDRALLARLASGVDIVVHLAGSPSVSESFENAAECARVHLQGTICVLDACRKAGVRRLIYMSSAEVYGRPETDYVAETHALNARSPYAAAKIGAEAMMSAYSSAFAMDVIIVRPFSVYGPGASPHALLCEALATTARGEEVKVRNLRPVRDYIFVSDVADAVVKACSIEPAAHLLVFNLGTMRGTSVADLCRLVLAAFDRPGQAIEEGEQRPGASEIYRLVSDNRCAQEGLGWTPRTSLEQGIHQMAEVYKR